MKNTIKGEIHPVVKYTELLSAMINNRDCQYNQQTAELWIDKTAKLACLLNNNIDYMDENINWQNTDEFVNQLYQSYVNLLPLVQAIARFFIAGKVTRLDFYVSKLKKYGDIYEKE